METMRVLILHNQIAPYRLPIFEELNKEFNVKVLFCEPRSPDRFWETELVQNFNFEWDILHGRRLGRFILNDPVQLVFEIRRSDVVVVAENVENIPSTVLALIISRLTRKRFILWTERIESPWIKMKFRGIRNRLKKLYERFLFFVSNEVAAYSRKSREYVLESGISPGKVFEGIQVMPKEVYPKRESRITGIPGGRAVLYLGYMRPEKGVLHLIRAFRRVKTDGFLILAGTGPLLEIVKRERPKNSVVTGYVPEEAKPYLYKNSMVFVLPTLHDPWGLVVNESFYYGTPVITTSAAAASTIVDEGKTGFVIPPGEEKPLRETLEKVLLNPKLIQKMKHFTRKKGKKYSDTKLGTRHLLKALERLK